MSKTFDKVNYSSFTNYTKNVVEPYCGNMYKLVDNLDDNLDDKMSKNKDPLDSQNIPNPSKPLCIPTHEYIPPSYIDTKSSFNTKNILQTVNTYNAAYSNFKKQSNNFNYSIQHKPGTINETCIDESSVDNYDQTKKYTNGNIRGYSYNPYSYRNPYSYYDDRKNK